MSKKSTKAPRVRYKNYKEYIESTKWKEVKAEWTYKTSGYDNVCQVSYTILVDKVFHHWRYSDDWSDDNESNVILISKEVHDFIHSEHDEWHLAEWGDTREKYITNATRIWFKHLLDKQDSKLLKLEQLARDVCGDDMWWHSEIVIRDEYFRCKICISEFRNDLNKVEHDPDCFIPFAESLAKELDNE